MRKRKRTSGNSPSRFLLAFAILTAGALAAAGKSGKPEPFALIAGSVFRDTGFSLAGAELTVEPAPEAKTSSKFKRIKTVTDARGEFAVRVPTTPMRYTVSVKAHRYRLDKKEVSIQGEGRVELFFRLEPESK
ncbi:MAG: hypothetical protein NT090_24820 [Acidobacteria bacterium]|nr:hypothetical protein [Acidobacteriota bacterium]